jgi:hypothetical protein
MKLQNYSEFPASANNMALLASLGRPQKGCNAGALKQRGARASETRKRRGPPCSRMGCCPQLRAVLLPQEHVPGRFTPPASCSIFTCSRIYCKHKECSQTYFSFPWIDFVSAANRGRVWHFTGVILFRVPPAVCSTGIIVGQTNWDGWTAWWQENNSPIPLFKSTFLEN